MAQEKSGGPPSRGGKPGGDRRDGRPGGGNRGGPQRGGPGRGQADQPRAETYETVKELTRGAGFRIDKYVLAEKGTHRPVKTEYRLTREGLAGTQVFGRLVDAQTAATAPLPEPEPVPEPVAEATPEAAEPATPESET